MTIRTLSVSFDLPITHRQIAQWRGAFIELAGLENDLFHNHKNHLAFSEAEDLLLPDAEHKLAAEGARENGEWSMVPNQFHYRYPLIQYRAYKGQATIVALNDGIEALQSVLSSHAWRINWEGAPRQLLITGMQMQEYTLRLLARPKTYRIMRWLALNEANYLKWQQCGSLVERISLLERVLGSHIVAFAGSMGWRIPERFELRLQDIHATNKMFCHGNPLIAFDLTYTANVLLPPHIALGKAVSHGYGWQVPAPVGKTAPHSTPGLVRRSVAGE